MLYRLPPFTLFLALLALLMLAPAGFAVLERDWLSMRSFLYAAIFTGFCAAILGFALAGAMRGAPARTELVLLILTWAIAPIFASIPLLLITPGLGYIGGYFEMMLAFTTTGGTTYTDLLRVPMAVHLWRGLVGWAGGLLTLTAAYVIFAPRRLGGFEVLASSGYGSDDMGSGLIALGAATPSFPERLARALRFILPVYVGMTAVLALGLRSLDETGPAAAIHAMSIISTTGISPYPGGIAYEGSLGIEMLAAVFLLLTATRRLYANASQAGSIEPWARDPELRLLAVLVLAASVALFARHWLGALTIDLTEGAGQDAFGAVWGALFTTLSFLTTTGFQSHFWESARDWSGLANPGLILLGLCAIGGGAATAAGGIKLIRFYALVRHGVRELDRIAQPSAVVGVGSGLRGILREGAFIAWAFVMLYSFGITAVMLGLTLAGMSFEHGLVAAVSTISNCGQALSLVLDGTRTFATTSTPERLIMAVAMILGRIEMLALIALFNPHSWAVYGFGLKRSGKARTKIPQSKW